MSTALEFYNEKEMDFATWLRTTAAGKAFSDECKRNAEAQCRELKPSEKDESDGR
jgi:hypothetical protein